MQVHEKVQSHGANKNIPKDQSNYLDQYNKYSISVAKGQTQEEIQLPGANKSIQNDQINYIQDTPNEKHIDRMAGKEKLAYGPSKKLKLHVNNGSIIVCPVECLIISCNFAFSSSNGIMKAVADAAG